MRSWPAIFLISIIILLGLIWPKKRPIPLPGTIIEKKKSDTLIASSPELRELICYTPDMPYMAECADISNKNERRQCSDRKLLQFIMENFHLLPGHEGCSEITVVSFVIDTSGQIKQPVIRRGIDPVFDAETLRVIQSLPLFIPGEQFGIKVPIQMNIPFRLMGK